MPIHTVWIFFHIFLFFKSNQIWLRVLIPIGWWKSNWGEAFPRSLCLALVFGYYRENFEEASLFFLAYDVSEIFLTQIVMASWNPQLDPNTFPSRQEYLQRWQMVPSTILHTRCQVCFKQHFPGITSCTLKTTVQEKYCYAPRKPSPEPE